MVLKANAPPRKPPVKKMNMAAIPRAHQFAPVPSLADLTNRPIIFTKNRGMITRLASSVARPSGSSLGKVINSRIAPTVRTVTPKMISSNTFTIFLNLFRFDVSINSFGTPLVPLTIDSIEVLFVICLLNAPRFVR